MNVTGRDEPVVCEDLLLVVVGAHLRAEMSDRPLGYRLREAILRWNDACVENGTSTREPLVCSDLWYLNNNELLEQPAISIGSPGVNAATAFLASRVPIALTLDDTLQIQIEPSLSGKWACLWGVDAAATASAVDLFTERYLPQFLSAAHNLA